VQLQALERVRADVPAAADEQLELVDLVVVGVDRVVRLGALGSKGGRRAAALSPGRSVYWAAPLKGSSWTFPRAKITAPSAKA
jgi:methylthioribose-1-phosphate isomerase